MKTNSAVPGSTREECPLLRLKASRPVVAWAVVLFLIVSAFSLSRAAVAAAGIDAAMAQLQAPDWEVRKQGVETLAPSAGESREVMNAVLGALRDGDSRVRRAAADATKQIGPKARSAIPALIELLADKDEQVRQSAAEALGQFGRKAAKAIPALQQNLHDRHPAVRAASVDALGRIGMTRRGSAQAVAAALSDSDDEVRQAAAAALEEASDAVVIPALVRALGDPDEDVRQSAANSLGRIGKPAVPQLLAALRSGNPVTLQMTALALGRVGPGAIPELVRTVRDPHGALLVRRYAAVALGETGSGDVQVIQALVAALQDDAPVLRGAAATALGKLGPAARNGTDALIAVLNRGEEQPAVRVQAAQALGAIGRASDRVVPALALMLQQPDPAVQAASVSALRRINAGTAAAGGGTRVADLIQLMGDRDPSVRSSAIDELGSLGADAAPAVKPLTDVVVDRSADTSLRTAAAKALGLIGPAANTALPELGDAFGEGDPHFGATILEAVERIGPPPRPLVVRLREALQSDRPEVRASAALELQQFAAGRAEAWKPFVARTQAPVLRQWLARLDELYGVKGLDALVGKPAGSEVSLTMFSVLGGRAAIEETLQMQALEPKQTAAGAPATVALASLKGVQVKSHPFAEMLRDTPDENVRMPFADLAPPDHFFAFFPDMEHVWKFVDRGSDFFTKLDAALDQQFVDYGLSARYARELGMDDPSFLALLPPRAIDGVGVILPDLFLIDGTDITVLIGVNDTAALEALLRYAGFGDLPSKEIVVRQRPAGGSIYLAARDRMLLLSTSRIELERVLALHRARGRGSLGDSAELRVMLRHLPTTERTRAWFYLSDPFLRRLLGPAAKIGQLRRLQARTDLEMLVAGALLARTDAQTDVLSPAQLAQLGYIPRRLANEDYALEEGPRAVSRRYGQLAAMKSLDANPVEAASGAEAAAYRRYIEDYDHYWRQFFDPIAMRLEETDGHELELTTFVLPLINSELYDKVREVVAGTTGSGALKIPVLTPKPVAMLSVNVSDGARLDLTRQFAKVFSEYTGLEADLLDNLGPGVHLALHDGRPIVAQGSGNLLRGLGAPMLGGNSDMFEWPVLAAFLTQPCQLLIELRDPQRVMDFMKEAEARNPSESTLGELHRVQGRDSWIYELTLLPPLRLSIGIEVQAGYLVLSNLPWTQQARITGSSVAALNGAHLQLNFDAIDQQQAALHDATYAEYRARAADGMGYLYPLLVSGVATTIDEAVEKHAAIFGFRPVHPIGGSWQWEDGEIRSTDFGTITRPCQPPYVSGENEFGVFQGFERLEVNMQMEDDGLRAAIRWVLEQ